MSELKNPHPYAVLPTGVPRAARWMVVVVSGLLGAAALSGAYSVLAGVRVYSVIEGESGFLTARQGELYNTLLMWESAGRYQGGAYLACAVMFLVWFSRMRRNLGLLAPDRFRNGPGWAIGSWFIPVAGLWLPYRIALDMWGAASPLPVDGQPYRAPVWPVNLWWGLFASNVMFSRWCALKFDRADNLEELRAAVVQYMFCDTLEIAAAGAAVFFVVRLTAMQQRKILEGPYRPAL
ncbi:DUF4328 domain-containing protein [Streptomyces davaonensis]|nr:DUF4328 domain-containing protein [Streptomyces davaonensis]